MAVNKFFNVKQGLTTGNITLDATTGNITAANVGLSGTVSALDLLLTGNVRSNLIPNANVSLTLGNSTRQFKDLYAANVTLGNQTITSTDTAVSFSGNIEANTITVSANIAANNVTVANTVTANIANIKVIVSSESITGNVIIANIGNFTSQLKANVFFANTANIGVLEVNNQLLINSTTESTSTTTGSIVTAGGVGVGKNLYVGGEIHVVGSAQKSGSIKYSNSVDGIDFNFNNGII